MLLYIRSDVDQSKDHYVGAVEMFLTEYLDGTVRKKNVAYKDTLTRKSENY